MKARRDLVGPGSVLIVFGLWPWALATLWPVFAVRGARLATVAAVCALVGLVAAHLAFAIWVLLAIRRRRAGGGPRAAADAPQRPDPDAGAAAVVARVATILTVLTLWGPFGIPMLSHFVGPRRVPGLDPELAWAYAGMTACGLLLGIVLVLRGALSCRAGSSSPRPG